MTIVKRTIYGICQFIVSSILSIVSIEIVEILCSLSEQKVGMPGWATKVYLLLFLIAPVGAIGGIYIVERMIRKSRTVSGWGLVTGLWTGLFGLLLVAYVLPYYGLYVPYRGFELLGVRIDEPIFILTMSLFAVLGYNCVQLLGIAFVGSRCTASTKVPELDEKAQMPAKAPPAVNSHRLAFMVLCLCIVAIFLVIVFRARIFNKEPKARAFLEQIVRSINENTELHKEIFQDVAWRKRPPWQYLNRVSDKYEISLVEADFDKRFYEYLIVFDNKTRFRAIVVDYRRDFALEEFCPEGMR